MLIFLNREIHKSWVFSLPRVLLGILEFLFQKPTMNGRHSYWERGHMQEYNTATWVYMQQQTPEQWPLQVEVDGTGMPKASNNRIRNRPAYATCKSRLMEMGTVVPRPTQKKISILQISDGSSVVSLQIKGYRMSLWAEHIRGLESSFERPESLECVRTVRWLSESNWNQYAAIGIDWRQGVYLCIFLIYKPREVQRQPDPIRSSHCSHHNSIVGCQHKTSGILGSGTTKAMMERFKRGEIREKRRKEREMERRLKAEDAAVGKISKINRDRDHEISEIVALCTYHDKVVA
ncbi:phospholipase D gamma 1 [Artemisia annua]|uniref:Phospholipase D gamma 1 n=1 Tax=Artemisia annua TaxID=35608 RepID=A0A2U1MMM1_ARTAN|nr:phospholipase D gamma 1 [Artemisia annua]